MRATPRRTPHAPTSDFDIELKLLLEAIYLKYQHDFRHYAVRSLRRRHHAGAAASLAAATSRSCRNGCCTSRGVRAAVASSSRCRSARCSATRGTSSRCAAGGAAAADLSVDQGLGGRLQHRRGSLVARDPAAEEGLLERTLFYATDINADALRQAEGGIYPLERVAQLQPELSGGRRQALALGLLSRGLRRARRSTRRCVSRVVFADHSLATDNVFSEAHLVSCRNVLIYFDRELQDRALGLFERSLCRRGFLGLGSKESMRFSKHADSFADFDPRERLYQKV